MPHESKLCRARACEEQVPDPKRFCPYHWNMLLRREKWDLLEAYGTDDWTPVLRRTQKLLERIDPVLRLR